MYRGFFARMIACMAAVAAFGSLPVAASDRHGDRDRHDDNRGRGGSHHHGGHDVDELAAELKALKARVRKLEGHLTREEMAGSYSWRLIQSNLISSVPPRVSVIEHNATAGTLQLNANGSFSYSGRETGFKAAWTFPTDRERTDRAEGFSGTWAYANDVLLLTIDGSAEVVPFIGGVGGRMFFYAGTNPADGSRTQVLMVRNATQ